MFLMKNKFILMSSAILLFMQLVFLSDSSAEKYAPIHLTAKSQFKYAAFLKSNKNYKKASREFSRILLAYPESKLISRTHFSLAHVLFLNEDYVKAYRAFEDYIKAFEKSRKGSDKKRVDKAHKYRKKIREILESKSAHRSKRKRSVMSGDFEVEPPSSGKLDRLKAVQVLVFDGKTLDDLELELYDIKKSGANTVIVRVFNNRGDRYHGFVSSEKKVGVYFQTSHVPVVQDILDDVIKLSHSMGLKVFAWMTTRYANYGMEFRKDIGCKGYDLEAGAVEDCKGLDFFHSTVVEHLENIYSDLADYDIDGVLFQDDLVLKHNEGFGVHATRLFKMERGKDISAGAFYVYDKSGNIQYTPLFWEWVEWKNKRLLTVADRLKEAVHEKRPNVKFAINLMYEALTNPPYALAWLSQDLEKAKEIGFDYFAIMAYHRQMSDELGKHPRDIKKMIKKMVIEATDIVGDESRLIFKVQTKDWASGEPIHHREVKEVLDVIKSAGNVSLALVPHRMDFPGGMFSTNRKQNKTSNAVASR